MMCTFNRDSWLINQVNMSDEILTFLGTCQRKGFVTIDCLKTNITKYEVVLVCCIPVCQRSSAVRYDSSQPDLISPMFSKYCFTKFK